MVTRAVTATKGLAHWAIKTIFTIRSPAPARQPTPGLTKRPNGARLTANVTVSLTINTRPKYPIKQGIYDISRQSFTTARPVVSTVNRCPWQCPRDTPLHGPKTWQENAVEVAQKRAI